MVQQAAQVKFTILTTILQAGMAVVFGIMVRCVGGEGKSLLINSHIDHTLSCMMYVTQVSH